MIPHELRTERLFLRPWRNADANPLAAIYAQPEFLEHMPAVDDVPELQCPQLAVGPPDQRRAPKASNFSMSGLCKSGHVTTCFVNGAATDGQL